MRGRAAPPHPGIYGIPPRESYAANAKRNMRGKNEGRLGPYIFRPLPTIDRNAWNRLSGIERKVVWSDLKK